MTYPENYPHIPADGRITAAEVLFHRPKPLVGTNPTAVLLDFDSDTPLVCSRDQSGDTTCESCQ